MNHHSFNGKLIRHPVSLPSNSVVHLAVTQCCAPTNHYVRGPCRDAMSAGLSNEGGDSRDGRGQCGRSLVSHFGHNRLVGTSDVRFPSSLGYRAGGLKHAICNNNNVVPSCFIPVSAALCASCRHGLMTGKIVVGLAVGCVRGCHGRLAGRCGGFRAFGRGFRMSSRLLGVVHSVTRRRGVRFGRRRCGGTLPLVGARLGTLVTHSL